MVFWIILACQIAVTAFVLRYAVRLLRRARRSRKWPTVQATVLDACLVQRGSTSFEPQVEYTYVVEGRQYVSRRGGVGLPLPMSLKRAREVVRVTPKGSVVTAPVDPGDPGYAVLHPGIHTMHLLLACLTPLFLLCAWAVVLALAINGASEV